MFVPEAQPAWQVVEDHIGPDQLEWQRGWSFSFLSM